MIQRAPLAVLLVSAISASGCSSANVGPAVSAMVATAVNIGAAAIQHELDGSCYGQCSYGTRCNHDTGMCDPDEERVSETPLHAEPELLDRRCADAQLEWGAAAGKGHGSQHPETQRLVAVLRTCEAVRADPGSPQELCGLLALEVAELDAGGLGPEHPVLKRARIAHEECLSLHAERAETAGSSP